MRRLIEFALVIACLALVAAPAWSQGLTGFDQVQSRMGVHSGPTATHHNPAPFWNRPTYGYGPAGIYDPTRPPVWNSPSGQYGVYQVGPRYVPPQFRMPGFN